MTRKHHPKPRRTPDQTRAEARAERRSGLLDAALVAIRRDGSNISMEAIAAEGGVTKPILYRHFGDREGLLQALTERFGDTLVARLRAGLPAGSDVREATRTAIDGYIGTIEQDPDLYRFIIQQTPVGGGTLQGLVDQVAALLATVIGETLRTIGADSGAAEIWAYSIVGMVHVAGDHWVAHPTMPRERLVEYLTGLLWTGMAGSSIRLVGDPEIRRTLADGLADDLAKGQSPDPAAPLSGL
ncbi:MAG TPA: TetR/AcrR family transcriptional regulator [Acidimicrobiales bacterium]|nr:TetR/AcrR family transcriptional regulator [Acidimicrobiales bacterium]